METYSVWVGGGEVNDYQLELEIAVRVASMYLELGYDDVHIVRNNK